MDRSSSKRGAGRLMTPKKANTVASKHAASEADQNAQFCNRIGCSGRIKYSSTTKTGSSDKAKCSKPSVRSSNETGKSFRSSSMMISGRKSYLASERKFSPLKFDPSESSLSGELEAPELMSSPSSPAVYQSESTKKSGAATATETGRLRVSSSIRPKVSSNIRLRISPLASSIPPNIRPQVSPAASSIPPNIRPRLCPPASSVPLNIRPRASLESSESVGKNMMKKRSSEPESSLSCSAKKNTAASPIDRKSSPSTTGTFVSNSRRSSPVSGGHSSVTASFSTPRSMNIKARVNVPSRQSGRSSSSVREPAGQSSARVSSSGSRSHRLSSSNGNNPPTTRPFASVEHRFAQLVNNGILSRHNTYETAEELLPHERIEQEEDEEMSEEEALELEASLYFSNLDDQHRDMRLDIDNMSYEELLALEERIGTVSTALSEEAFSKCLRKNTYQPNPSKPQITGSGEDGEDIKCTICQEEYVSGDEIGKLAECQHGYHIECINQWLQLKNWCPICKTSAGPSQSSSSL